MIRTPAPLALLLVVAACKTPGGPSAAAQERAGGAPTSSARAAEATSPGGGQAPAPRALPPVHLKQPAAQVLQEERPWSLTLDVVDPPPGARISVLGLPPGARFDEATRTMTLVPDFVQGGWSSLVKVELRAGAHEERVVFPLSIEDTIAPPPPVLKRTEKAPGGLMLVLEQRTDEFLDAPGFAGRAFEARVFVPEAATASRRYPVHVELHGVGASAATGAPRPGFITILPDDPSTTYWWGYADTLPSKGPIPSSAKVRPYTARRVLHVLEWVLKRLPGADADRVSVGGWSMGGAGALALALLHPRHFSTVQAKDAATIPRLHRPARIAQLSTLWGTPEQNLDDGAGMGVWDRLDMTRALRDDPDARDVFVVTKHGKDDFVIHFAAAVKQSPLTGMSFYGALDRFAVGRVVAWDEGGHGPVDPARPEGWWHGALAQAAEARRSRPHVAFLEASVDADPGRGEGNGRRPWDRDRGFAGDASTSGDTGWDGDLAGARGLGLYWRGAEVLDLPERLEIPLKSAEGEVTVDVVPRRLRRFLLRGGDVVRYAFGDRRGVVTVAEDGTLRVPGLVLTPTWTRLVIERSPLSPQVGLR